MIKCHRICGTEYCKDIMCQIQSQKKTTTKRQTLKTDGHKEYTTKVKTIQVRKIEASR